MRKLLLHHFIELDKNLKDKKSLEEIILIKVPTEIYPGIKKVKPLYLFLSAQVLERSKLMNNGFQKLYNSRNN